MKLHDLHPAPGSRTPRKRVGRGIAAGQGKTAGRGTKGQKARAGGSIAPWFEGGQTPLHIRIPKLRGFRNRLKVDYEVVNLGAIARLVERGALEPGELPGKAPRGKPAPITVNQEILRATGAVRTLDKPLKILGHGEVGVPLFVVADAFSRTAVAKIEAAGGSASVIEVPGSTRPTTEEAEPGAANADRQAAETRRASSRPKARPAAPAAADGDAAADDAETPAEAEDSGSTGSTGQEATPDAEG
jgi:large subunit ribosomal protein L15